MSRACVIVYQVLIGLVLVGLAPAVSLGQHELKATRTRVLKAYGDLPISFEANQGQADRRVRFLSRSPGYMLLLTGEEAILRLDAHAPLHMRLKGANPQVRVQGVDELAGKSNYFVGNDRAKWRTNVPNYSKVRYRGVYPGIDLVYYGNQRALEYDFLVSPGADPKRIRLQLTAVQQLDVQANGDLLARTAAGDVRLNKPVMYQVAEGSAAGGRVIIDGRYKVSNGRDVSFEIAKYDRRKPLIIDPVFIYSTFLGGSSSDTVAALAVDAAGNAYVAGTTGSVDFPVTPGALQPAFTGGPNSVFITKLNASGSGLVYSTYLNGSSPGSEGTGLAVDGAGNAYVTGTTLSPDFPTTANAFDRTCGTDGTCNHNLSFVRSDAFLAKLDPNGASLLYFTYFGGSDVDEGGAVAVDNWGHAWTTGLVLSTDFPISRAIQPVCGGATFGGCIDVFVAKVDTTQSGVASLRYSTYLGGSGDDRPGGIATDAAGNAYITGNTISTNFPTPAGALDRTCGDDRMCGDIFSVAPGPDAFVTKLNPTGSAIVYSTYLGGNSSDSGNGIAVDPAGRAYVAGSTLSTTFPTTPQAFATVDPGYGSQHGFVTRLNANGTALSYSTYIGGASEDEAIAVAIDAAGFAYITGNTFSADFPVTPAAAQNRCGSCSSQPDAFVMKLDQTGSNLVYSSFLGGSNHDLGEGIAVDYQRKVFVAGSTNSINFHTTPSALDTSCGTDGVCNDNQYDAFVSKFALPLKGTPYPALSLSTDFLAFGNQMLGTASPPQTVTLSSTGSGPVTLAGIAAPPNFIQSSDCPVSLAPKATCAITIAFAPEALGNLAGTVTVSDDAPGNPHIITVTGTGVSGAKAVLTPSTLRFGSQKLGTTSAPRIVTVTNTGTGDLVIDSISIFPPFAQTGNCQGIPIKPGLSCAMAVTFHPVAAGQAFSYLTLIDNTTGLDVASVYGTGVQQ